MQPSSNRVDDESKKFLADVKKGNPRKFVMVKEGVEIDRLYVFKKGPFERYVRKAKKDGVRGEAYWGIIRGNGLDIRFELSRTDGFSAPPGPPLKLKEFLKENTAFKFEPDYVIVDALAPIDESDQAAPDAAADAGEIAPQDTGDTAVQEDTGGVAPDGAGTAVQEDAAEKFLRLLKAIVPHVKRALTTKSSLSDELQSSVREAQDLGRQRDFEQGMVALRRVGALTKQALAEADAAKAATAEKSSRRQEAEAKRRGQWEERIAQIEPRFAAAIKSAAPDAGKLKIVMNYAQRQSKQRQFVKALVGLDRLERMLSESA